MKKKLIWMLIFILSGTWAMGQMNEDRLRLGVIGGVNFQNLNGSDRDGNKLGNKIILGYHVGVNAMIPLVPEFYFQPGLLLTTKGGKYVASTPDVTYRLTYLELPLNLVYRGLLGTGHIMLGFGPYVGYGLMGRAASEGADSQKIVFANTVAAAEPLTRVYFKRLDLGGNIFVGYEMAMGLYFQLNSQLGMIRINPDDNRYPDDDLSLKNTGFGLSIGYRF
jgi:hypothetical protein